MTQQDLDYRKEHAVVPQLDFFNGGHSNIVAPPVQYTKFAAMGNITKVNGGKVAGGIGNTLEGAAHMASGDFGYGIGKLFAGLAKTTLGVVDPGYVKMQQVVCEEIQKEEAESWNQRFFLTDFVPAEGQIGDIVCESGEYDEFYCGLGHRFFDNGDYFEGMFVDGRILEGIYIFANGARYLGTFDENLNFDGLGTILYADGSCYYGVFCQSLRDGIGTMWYSDGVYTGHWENDVRAGYGMLRVENKFYEGDFENDQPLGDIR